MQDRRVFVRIEGQVGADAGLRAELAEDRGTGQEVIEEVATVTLQFDSGGLYMGFWSWPTGYFIAIDADEEEARAS